MFSVPSAPGGAPRSRSAWGPGGPLHGPMRSWGGQANANVCGRGRLKVMRDMQTERGAARDGEAVGHSCARAVGTPTRASNPDTAARAGPRAGGGTNPAPCSTERCRCRCCAPWPAYPTHPTTHVYSSTAIPLPCGVRVDACVAHGAEATERSSAQRCQMNSNPCPPRIFL